MNVVDLTRAYSFDCYGTLIDWESGIRAALTQVPELAEVLNNPALMEESIAQAQKMFSVTTASLSPRLC